VDWKFACRKEIEFISLYGRINKNTGTLANMTDGGDGNLGLTHTAESLKKISEASIGRPGHWKGKKMSEEFKKKLSQSKMGKSIVGHPATDGMKEAVRKHSIGNQYHLGKKHTEESKKKMSQKMKGRIAYNRIPVFQYSLSGAYINKFDSMAEAKKNTQASEICAVCAGSRKSSGGYMWRLEYLGDNIEPLEYKSDNWNTRLSNKKL
jgi:group I intron endonuclease